MKLITIGLWILLLILQYSLWVGTGSMAEVHHLQQQLSAQQQQINAHKRRNQQLESEIHSLQHQTRAVENRARYELGMVRPGETYYHIVRHE